MSEKPYVMRLYPDGDPESGLQPAPWEMDVLEGIPDKRYHQFFARNPEAGGELSVGVSTGGSYAERVTDYPCDEIGFVLEGTVTITDNEDIEHSFTAGEGFFIRRGLSGIWKQSDGFRKLYMMMYYS